MNRKTFLYEFSERWLKPIFLLLFLLLVLALLKELFTESGLQLIKFALLLVAVYSSFYIIASVFNSAIKKLNDGLSETQKSRWKLVKKIANYLLIVALIYVIYDYWNKDKSAVIFGAILYVIGILSDIFTKQTRQEITDES